MPDVTQNVIIEFISDTSKLAPAVDQLENIGKIEQGQAAAFKATNTEINKQAAALKQVSAVNQQIDATGKVTKKNVADLAQAVKGMSGTFQEEFKKGVIDGLKQAGVSVKEFEKTIGTSFEKTETATLSLKSQLRAMVEQLAQLKVQGKDTSAEYLDLAEKAGHLKDAISDANQEVKNFGSDTSTFDGLIGLTQGVAGGFAVVQGAAALFGDESEELQKTLLRVNAAMAVLQGLQQIQITLQKESAAAQLANTIATKAQAAAQVVFNFVVGSSTGLLKAFRIALASTGVGLLIIGLIKLVEVLSSTNDELEDANALIESQKSLLEGLDDIIQRNIDVQEARARAANAAESEILRIQGRALVRQRDALIQSNQILIAQRDQLDATSEAWFNLNQQIQANSDKITGLNNSILVKSINLEKQLADERAEAEKKRRDAAKKSADDAKKARDDRLQKEKEERAAGFADFKASVELQLLAVEKGSQEELEIRKLLLKAELQQQLDNDKLTENQRKLLIKKFFADRIALEKQFAIDRDKIILENIASDIQAELQGLEISNERRLELTETAIRLQAQMEIDAANGNASKIAEINGKMDKAIREARIASIEETLARELALNEVSNASHLRAIQRELDNEKTGLRERKNLIDELTGISLEANFKRIAALNKEREDGLISQQDYNLKYAQLIDEQVQIVEDGEKKKTDTTKSESQKRLELAKREVDNITKVASAVSDVLAGINDIQTQRENDKISAERQHIKELQDAGAITEKDAIARMKKIDAEERKIKREQAKRDKEIAIFNAVINTARGVAAAIPNPFLIALAIAVGAAQVAIIASRPLPKFAKGKKDGYQGLAQVGEAGSELIQHEGKMYIAEKPEVVWLGKSDKVYSHKETVAMMTKPSMNTERNGVKIPGKNGLQIDYEKMGKAVGKHVQQQIIIDGVTAQVIKQKEFTNYLDGRRSF